MIPRLFSRWAHPAAKWNLRLMVGEGSIEDFSLLIFKKLSSIPETLAGGSLSDECFSTSSSLDILWGVWLGRLSLASITEVKS